MKRTCLIVGILTALVCGLAIGAAYAQQQAPRTASKPRPVHVLFLGHVSEHHDAIHLFPLLAGPLSKAGYQLTFVATPDEALRPEMLRYYDEIMIYANHTTITPEQEKALLDFVESGKGLVAIHCASAMFTNSEKYIAMVGGQFQKHGTGDFTTEIVQPEHPVMKGMQPFTTWDETYVHTKHNTTNRTVLMERVDAQGREPYTWVRTQGKGRVFYTAYGHDERTWNNPGFQKLIANAAEWVLGDVPRQAAQQGVPVGMPGYPEFFPSDQQGRWPCQTGKELARLPGQIWPKTRLEDFLCYQSFGCQFFGSRARKEALTPWSSGVTFSRAALRINAKPAAAAMDFASVDPAVDISPIGMTGIAHDEGTMSYDKNSLTVYAGETVSVVFVNPDVAPHNFLLITPGSLKTIGAVADKMVRMGTGEDDNYVPKMKEILFVAPVLEPKKTTKFEFKAPAEPGQYPYICTFPGHWKTMNGVLTVLARSH